MESASDRRNDRRFDPLFATQLLLEIALERSLEQSLQRLDGGATEGPHLACGQADRMDHLSGGTYEEFSLNAQIPTVSFYCR
jgi:hypothetical protein